MTWHVAASLETLRQQLNTIAPNRSKVSDGSIGDAAHASRDSDHNPWYRNTVTARDFTHDPRGGVDCNRLADELVATRDRRVKYIIWNGRIVQSAGSNPWVWRPYSGKNPHTHHLHLSVKADPSCEDPGKWGLPMLGGGPVVPAPVTPDSDTLRRGSKGPRVEQLQRVLKAWYPHLLIAVDGDYGPATEAAVKDFQRRAKLTVDGIAGPQTLGKLGL